MSMRFKLFSGTAILFVLLASLVFPSPAMAVPPVITGVDPAIVANNVATDVTITGTDFEVNNVAVTLEPGGIPLAIKSWSTTTLVITVPAGISAGVYSIQVTNNPSTTPESQLYNPFTVTDAPTPIPPTATPLPTATPGPFGRPQLAVKSYRTNVGEISYGKDFNLIVRLTNAGQFRAYNVQAVFSSSDLTPLKTGGVKVVGDIEADNSVDVGQQMTAIVSLYGKTSVLVDVTVTYYDEKGTAYTEKFTLNLPVVATNYTYVTATPTSVRRSQLVITSYETDLQPLQPGLQFALKLNVQNMGNATAKGVTMIVGGGSASGGSGSTPQPGGVSGGSGEFTNFAPVGSSNIQSLGDIESGGTLSISQNLIVNVSTNPGAYPVKITFSYTDDKGNVVNDEQVITLLVYNLPYVEVNFYQPVTGLYLGQSNLLPLQIVNLGKKATVLGNMKVESSNGMIENGTGLVGALDTGGYFTLDSTVIPDTAGPLELTITIDYTDDFNQPRSITKTLSLEVMEAPVEPTYDPNMPPGEGGGGGAGVPAAGGEETFLHKAWRFVLGLFGLDSGLPVEQPVQPPQEQPIPVPSKGGGSKG